MRILFYHSAGSWNGGSRALARAAQGLAGNGHQVSFVCPAESRLERHLTFGSFEIVPFPRLSAVGAAWRLRGELRERFVEVAFVGSARDHRIVALAARLAERAAVLRRLGHGEGLRGSGFVTLNLTAGGFVFAAEDEMKRVRPPAAARIPHTLAPLGVDASDYAEVRAAPPLVLGGPESGARYIVVVYDPSGRHAAGNALRVVSHLAQRHPDLRLAFVGAGAQADHLRLHAAALRIPQRVTLLGARDDELAVLRAAELGWVVAEGDDGAWGMLDLAALGVPVLAERNALARHYIADGITGVHLPPSNPADSAGIIARLLAGAEERQSMGAAARARVAREFPETEMIAAFERAALSAADRSTW